MHIRLYKQLYIIVFYAHTTILLLKITIEKEEKMESPLRTKKTIENCNISYYSKYVYYKIT